MTKKARNSMKKRQSLQQVVWENWTVTWKTIKSEHSLIPYMKINSKAPTVRLEIIKRLEENIDNTLIYIATSFRSISSSKVNKRNLIKLKTFCTAQETITKTKRQNNEQEKIFANDI